MRLAVLILPRSLYVLQARYGRPSVVTATKASAATIATPASIATNRPLAIHAPPLTAWPPRLGIHRLEKLAGDGEDGRGLQAPGDAGKIDVHLGPRFLPQTLLRPAVTAISLTEARKR